MVHFPTLSSTAYVFSGGFSRISQRGFPHSEIPGSKPICGSPGLIAAYRVLHRLLMPRHSPYTLSSLTIKKLELTPSVLPKKNTLRQLHAHCACVVGKNYRLQDIQLSKITLSVRAQPSARFRRSPKNRPHRIGQAFRLIEPGGEYRARTGDLLVANQALSQLS